MSHTTGGKPVAVVPLKALDKAKSRLAGHLDATRRRQLTGWMFSRVVAACRAASQVESVMVVAGDEAAAELAASLGIAVLVERRPGLTAALAAVDAVAGGAPATLVVAADLPLARAADLDAVCRAGQHAPCVVVAPTLDGGTGALLRRPPAVVLGAYGPGSAAAHLRAAVTAGARAVRLEVPGLALDVDTADQLRVACSRDRRVATWIHGLSAG